LHAVILLFVVLGAGSFAENIPKAVLAGILIKVGTDIIDWGYLKRLATAPRAGVVIMFVVFFFTVFVDLISAVALGLIMASFLFMQRMADLQLKNMLPITSSETELPLTVEEKEILDKANGRLLLYHLGGPMSFGAAKGMARRLASFEQYDALLLDFCSVPIIDFTSTMAVEDMILDARACGRSVYVISCHDEVTGFMRKQGVLTTLDDDCQFADRTSALKYAYSKLE